MNKLLYCFFALILLAGCASTRTPPPDEIVVVKSEREMYLLHNNVVYRTYDINLGQEPYGHKQKRGDMKTPEGEYHITWHNPNSEFYLSLHISYPDREDREKAEARGHDPGDLIVIHGMRGRGSRSDFLKAGDWTEGCIAMTNEEMHELFHLVEIGTPITIYP
ncbi:MAG: L,D-transpeptidase family protein [Legionellales bacterium]|jgi:murein L,D-transpeptidase YafK